MKAGETVRVEVLQEKRPVVDVPVVALLDDISGLNAYMDIDALNRLMREGPRVSGAMLTTDPLYRPAIYRELKETPRVASVTVKQASVDSFKNTVAKNMMHMRMINLSFAIIIALGVVYNGARISLSERSRELATLRVIGFTQARDFDDPVGRNRHDHAAGHSVRPGDGLLVCLDADVTFWTKRCFGFRS